MAEVIRVWGEGRTALRRPEGEPIDVPEDYEEIEPGDPFVTRHVKKLAERVFLRMKKTSRRWPSAVVGILAPRAIVAQVQAEAQATRDRRAAKNAVAQERRKKKEERDNASRVERLRALLPGMPADDAQAIVQRAFEVGSGRVGRSSRLDDERKLINATKAHIRHAYTDYDLLMLEGWSREDAREHVHGAVAEIFLTWQSPAT